MKNKLSAQYLNSSLNPGRYYDDTGTGLNMHVRPGGSKNWSQKIRFQGKQYELGLGSYPTISLAEARKAAADNKVLVASGINPKSEKAKPASIPTFSEVSDVVIKIKQAELTNEKHQKQWRSTLEQYVFPKLGSIPVNEITVDLIHDTLKPIWLTKTETASRIRGRIQTVLDYAIVKRYMSAPNPASWNGNLSALLPSKSKTKRSQHHPALQLQHAQHWWKELKSRDGIGKKALTLLVLTASRSAEIRGMTWDELALFTNEEAERKGYAGIWVCPPNRMKAKQEHRVPITFEMLKLIGKPPPGRPKLVFGTTNDQTLSDMTLSALMKRINKAQGEIFTDQSSGRAAVPHGLRSTFRDWVAEYGHSREAAELQLAHKFGSAVEHAYYRTDLLEERAILLQHWHQFLEGN